MSQTLSALSAMAWCSHMMVSVSVILVLAVKVIRGVEEYIPENRYFTAEATSLRPDLECQVGLKSMMVEEVFKVKCSDAWKITVNLDKKKAYEMKTEGYISEQDAIRRTYRFGIKGSGIKFESKPLWEKYENVDNWVCGYNPILGVVVYDCIPTTEAPLWWTVQYMGPKFDDGVPGAAKVPRPPGCNGGVCYCNNFDYCNDKWNMTINDYECPDDILPEYRAIDTRCIGDGKGRSPPMPE